MPLARIKTSDDDMLSDVCLHFKLPSFKTGTFPLAFHNFFYQDQDQCPIPFSFLAWTLQQFLKKEQVFFFLGVSEFVKTQNRFSKYIGFACAYEGLASVLFVDSCLRPLILPVLINTKWQAPCDASSPTGLPVWWVTQTLNVWIQEH